MINFCLVIYWFHIRKLFGTLDQYILRWEGQCPAKKRQTDRQTDRQTVKLFDTLHRGMQFFISVKFATSLLALLAGG